MADGLARLILVQAWQIAVLVVVVVIATRMAARQRPHLAYVLWLVVLLKCLFPPCWSSSLGAFCWLQAAVPANSATKQHSVPDHMHYLLGERPTTIADLSTIVPAPIKYADDTNAARRAKAVLDESPKPWLSRIAAIVWISGCLLACLVTGVRGVRCIWQLRHNAGTRSVELESLLDQLRRQLKVRRRVDLLITTSRVGPAVIGLVRPTIVLPEVIVRNRKPSDLRPILAHELLHVRRGDLWLGLLQTVVKTLWWLHPLAWWACRLATREAERCCDEQVIGELRCDPREYAGCLLEILELKRTLRPVPAFPGMKPVEVTSQRLESIMKLGHGCHKRTPWWCWVVLLPAVLTTMPGAAFMAAETKKENTAPRPWRPVRVKQGTESTDATQQLLVVEIRFVTTTSKLIEQQVGPWRLASMETHTKSELAPTLDSADVRPPRASKLPRTGVTTEKRLPSIHKIVDDADMRRMMKAFQGDVRSNILFAPRIATLSGQSAVVQDTTQRPFVVGLTEDGEPQIRVVSSGNHVRIRPVLRDSNELSLDYDVKVSEVTEVQETMLRVAGRDEPVKLQIPEVRTSSVQATIDVAVGKTVVIGGLTTQAERGREAKLLVMVTTRRFDDKEPPRETRAQRDDVGLLFGVGVDSDLGLTGQVTIQDTPLAPASEILSIRSSLVHDAKRPTDPPTDEQILAALDKRQDKPRLLHSKTRENVRIVKEKIREFADPPRLVPLIGQARLHHAHFKCTLYFTERNEVRWPVPHEYEQEVVQVVHVDHNCYELLDEEPRGFTTSAAYIESTAESQPDQLYTLVYNVADLVIPIPPVVPPPVREDGAVLADFDTLVKLITTTIAPESWDAAAGGNAAIEAFPTNLSVVVSQTQNAHQEITDLLEQLRRLQDVQIAIQTHVLRVPKLSRYRADFDRLVENHSKSALSKGEASRLLDAIQEDGRANLLNAPKVTLFNGQAAHFSLDQALPQATLKFLAIVAEDRRSIRVKCGVGEDSDLAGLDTHILPDGDSLLLRSEADSYILVTPRVLVVEEEEEHLGYGSHR